MSELVTQFDGTVMTVTLNRPEKRNALSDGLIGALSDALDAADRDAGLSAVVVRGAGKDFCSGADLESLRRIAESDVLENLEDAGRLQALFLRIRTLRHPVIAAVTGRALAGGCGLATACDVVLAAESARFGYPEVKIGFVPAMVMAILRRNVSEKRAFEAVTRGFEMSAADAERAGLVTRVFPDDGFESGVAEYVASYAGLSRSAVRLSKKLLYQMDGLTFESALETGAEVNAIARLTPDCRAGIARFLGKES